VQTGDKNVDDWWVYCFKGLNQKRVIIPRYLARSSVSYGLFPRSIAGSPHWKLHDDGTVKLLIGTNDNWQTYDQSAGIHQHTIRCRKSKTAVYGGRVTEGNLAIIADLPAGNYTAIVRGG